MLSDSSLESAMNQLCKFAAAAVFLSVPLLAQVNTPASFMQQTWTTGMVGFAANQTVQLNVLNVGPTSVTTMSGGTATTAQTSPCSVQLGFYDLQNRPIKPTSTAVAPGSAVTLTLTKGEIPAVSAGSLRTEVRAVVRTVPNSSPGSAAAAATPFCSLFTTLEVFDSATGATHLFTSEVRLETANMVVQV